jgi:hypothetical protein
MRARQFLGSLLAMYAILMVALGINYALLWRAGELLGVDEIIARQHRDGAIYNALSISFADYKYAAYRAAAPWIVAIGTSRAMQIRQHDFVAPFYNLGGLSQGPDQANALADRLLLRGDAPRLVIFALDFWTFCQPPGQSSAGRPAAAASVHDGMGEPPRHFLTYRLLLEGRFAIADYVKLFSPQSTDDVDRVGLGARLGASGFAADGSIYGAAPESTLEARWRGMFARIGAGTDQFAKDCTVSEAALDALRLFVNRMEAAGSRVALMLAPLPGAVIERLQTEGRYAYMDELRRLLAARFPLQFADFLDLRGVSPDSEFLDGMHGGDVTYMRIILAMARRPGSPLRWLVDEVGLEMQIGLWAGHARIPTDPINRRFFPEEGARQ